MMVPDTDTEAEPGDMVSVGPFNLPPGYVGREIDLAICNLVRVNGYERDTLHTPAVCIAATQEFRAMCDNLRKAVHNGYGWGGQFSQDPRPFSSTPKPRRVQVRQPR